VALHKLARTNTNNLSNSKRACLYCIWNYNSTRACLCSLCFYYCYVTISHYYVHIKSMSAIKIIEESIIQVQKMNISICRGPLYIWGPGDIPEACDCFGAVLLSRDKAYKNFPKGWLKELCVDILDKDYFWFYKFNY